MLHAKAASSHPVARALLGVAMLTAMDAVIKGQLQTLPFVQSVFMRFFCAGVIVLILLALVRPPFPSRRSILANLVRLPIGVLTTLSFFFSVSTLPLAEALALSFLSPLFVALFGFVLLKEHVDRRIWMALAFGLCGMLIMVWPRLGHEARPDSLGVLAALAAAVTYALNLVLLRQLAQHEHPIIIVAFQNCGSALLLALPAWLAWTPMGQGDLAMFGLAGVLAIAGLLLLTSAFAMAKAARLAAVDYTALLWASALGWIFFDEQPGLGTLLGAALIVAGALAVSRR